MPVVTGRRAWEVTTRFGKLYHKIRYGHDIHPCGITTSWRNVCEHDGNHVCGCGFSWPQVIKEEWNNQQLNDMERCHG